MLNSKTKWSRTLLLMLVMTVLLALPLYAAYPKQNDYVHNTDDVLSANTVSALKDTNTRLQSGRGVVIAVCVAEDTGKEEIDDFSRNLFKEWKIENGVLLVIDLKTDDYYAVQSMDIDDILTNDKLSEILNGYMEVEYADGNIDRGVYKTILKLDEFLTASLPAVNNGDTAEIGNASENEEPAEEKEETSGFVKVLKGVFTVLLVLVILAVVLVGGLFIAAMFNDTALELFQTYVMGMILRRKVTPTYRDTYAYDDRLYGEPARRNTNNRNSRRTYDEYEEYSPRPRQNKPAGRQSYDPYAGYEDYNRQYTARQQRPANRQPNPRQYSGTNPQSDRGNYRVRNSQSQTRQQQYYDDYR